MTTQRHWYNDRELFLQGLVRSNYVTSITDWFMGFAGKWAELVLYGTVLYACAELYPGVHLPVGLSLAVFLIQMGALDIGGLSLGKLAKQAREDGNTKGADQAATLSKWLIAIMLTGWPQSELSTSSCYQIKYRLALKSCSSSLAPSARCCTGV